MVPCAVSFQNGGGSRKAQWRLCTRYKKLAAKGKNKLQIVTAIGRELVGFIWAIAVRTEAKFQTEPKAAWPAPCLPFPHFDRLAPAPPVKAALRLAAARWRSLPLGLDGTRRRCEKPIG